MVISLLLALTPFPFDVDIVYPRYNRKNK